MLRGTARGGVVPVAQSLDGLSEISEQVPSICDLGGIGSTLTDAVGIGAGTVPSDDLDAGSIM